MLVELHMIQNFAPANLNRDDTNAPKDCVFGMARRARVSSQAWKRAIRGRFQSDGLLGPDEMAVRTKRVHEGLTERLHGLGVDQAQDVALAALKAIGLKLQQEDGEMAQVSYLVFVGRREIDALARLCAEHRDELLQGSTDGGPEGTRPRRRRSDDVGSLLAAALDGGKAVDLALFGRMVADLPARNVDAACQVAHAISTHRVETEFDFYTAVDDLKGPKEDAGAGMMGTVEFNSACFYRYSNVDVGQLVANLGGDRELARRGLDAFLRASVHAVPGGKQNSMAAHSPPSLVFTVVRGGSHWPWSLVNAFCRPVWIGHQDDLIHRSVSELAKQWASLSTAYGADNVALSRWLYVGGADDEGGLPPADRVSDLGTLVHDTVSAAFQADA